MCVVQVKEYIEKNKQKFFNELEKFVSFKSVSTDSFYASEIKNCQKYLMDLLTKIGAKVSVFETNGINAVFGELLVDKKALTVLFYGHYDVQPACKAEGWEGDPFQVLKKNNKFHARGVADNKGPVLAFIKSIETLQNTVGLKINIKFLIEGEEEIGSKNLSFCIKENKDKLKSDVVLVCDTGWLNEDTPAIPYGLKGLMYAYVRVNGPSVDLHSGTYGGIVKNPHLELARILVRLKNSEEHVLIPEFYDDVREITVEEKKLFEKIPLNVENLRKEVGCELVSNDKVELLSKKGALPTLDIHGITGGYTGKGAKTIIPSYAEAKISTRLVPNQKPKKIFNLFAKYVKSINSKAIITLDSLAEPFLINPNNEFIKKASTVMAKVFGKKPVLTREGGSIPVIVTFKKELKVPVVLFGIVNHDCNIHSPKENFSEWHFYKGVEALAVYLKELSKNERFDNNNSNT